MRTLLAISLLATVAQAGQRCHSHGYPQSPANWNTSFVFPKHDPAVGTLQSVTVTWRSPISLELSLENMDSSSAAYQYRFQCAVNARRPDASILLTNSAVYAGQGVFPPFDGTGDFGGPSGETFLTWNPPSETSAVLLSGADLALFTATTNGETISLGVDAPAAFMVTGLVNYAWLFDPLAGADLTVCYGYREACQADDTPMTTTNWQTTRTFAKHDPAVGPLRAVRVRVRAAMSASVGVENPSPIAVDVTENVAVRTTVHRPDASQLMAVDTAHQIIDPLAPFDGVIDFDGPSGQTHSGIETQSSGQVTLTSPLDLALFTAASPGETITLGLQGAGMSTASGAGPIVTMFATDSRVEVIEVCYDHSAHVVPFCFGDGSGAACPCGNASPVGAQQGCLNSLGLGGELRGAGAADLGEDSLVFTASNLPATTSVLFFQGTNAISVPFGDGLRCTNASVARLGTRTAAGGMATFPPVGATISDLGQATPGTTLRYQAYYRNIVPFCTPSRFNTTNGLRITW